MSAVQCPTCGAKMSESERKIHVCPTKKAVEKPDLTKRFSDFDLKK